MPKDTIEEKAEKLVADHQMKYSEALSEARAAAETTATPAWQHNYAQEIKQHWGAIKSQVQTIRSEAENLLQWDTNEDSEKMIRDAVKALADERIRHQAWKSRAVYQFSSKAELCENIIRATTREAQEYEQNHPLVNRGLASAVDTLLKRWPRVEWDDEAGILRIKGDAAEAGEKAA